VRRLVSVPVTAEQVCFPHAAQGGVVRRKSGRRRRETVYLLTSREPERLSPEAWLRINRQSWGIENGLHQRLDVTAQEDRCRVRSRNGAWVLGMFRRLAISLFAEWRLRNPTRAKYVTLSDFLARMADDNHRLGFTLLTSLNPSLSYRLS
jgi:hypothetical protein